MYKMKNACDGRNKLSQSIYSDSFLSIKLERKTGNRFMNGFLQICFENRTVCNFLFT